MTESPGFLFTILAFLLVIGPLVFVHEMGHYLAGRWFGVKADAFSIGFGREVAGWTDRRGTRWKVGWLPLGGYVKFAGDMNPASQPSADWLALPPAERNRTFQAKPVWQRAIIVAAGPFVNLALAVLILAGFAVTYGEVRAPSVIGTVAAGSAAERAGLLPGDRITALGGVAVDDYRQLRNITVLHPGERITIDIVRNGRPIVVPATIGTHVERDRFGNEFRMGLLGIGAAEPEVLPVAWWRAPLIGARDVGEIIAQQIDGIGQIVTGRRSVDELGGPIKIAKVSGEQMTLGWVTFVGFVAMLSINLGFINLLPVPILDGGHLLFYGLEAVRRRPVTPQVMEWAFRGGMMALLALMVFVTLNDLGSIGLWRGIAGLIG